MLKIKNHNPAELAPGKQFKYADGVFFWVRPLTGTILRNFRKLCATEEIAYSATSQRMELVEKINDDKLNDLIADYILEKWEGVGGEDGQPLPVTLESKKLILDQLAIKNFVWAAAKSLDTTEAETKNSQTSPISL